jgi:biopolymer transport protein TolR
MGMGSSRGNGSKGLVADINVTPLVDVMLVLLIIFMVTAPMMTQGLNVDLPQTTTNEIRQEENPLTVTVEKDGSIYIDKIKFDKPLLREQLAKTDEKRKEDVILLYADANVPYGLVVSIMDDIKVAGFKKLGVPTKQIEEKQ